MKRPAAEASRPFANDYFEVEEEVVSAVVAVSAAGAAVSADAASVEAAVAAVSIAGAASVVASVVAVDSSLLLQAARPVTSMAAESPSTSLRILTPLRNPVAPLWRGRTIRRNCGGLKAI